MQLKQLLQDDDAVSPVIGVILMVAITVILAAVIATFVLGLGDQVSDTSPQASFSFEFAGSSGGSPANLTITHTGGDSIKAKEVFIRGDPGTPTGDVDNLDQTWGNWTEAEDGIFGETKIRAGNSIEVEVGPDAEIDVIWERTEGDKSATLGSWEGPDA